MSLICCVKDRLVPIHCDVSERLVTHIKWIFKWCVEQQKRVSFSLMMMNYEPLKLDV